MATYQWSIPSGNTINGLTYIKDTDNKIQATMDDLVDFVNAEGAHEGQGLTYDFVDKLTSQTITGIKTFSNGLVGNVTGNVTGNVNGNANTATKLATTRTISLTGDITGSATFDGTANATINASVNNDSHTHDERYYTEAEIDLKLADKQDVLVSGTHIKTVNGVSVVGSGNVTLPTATGSVAGTVKASVSNGTLYLTF